MGLGHGAARIGPADLHHDERLAEPRRPVGGQHERPPVLEALDVGGDHPDVGLLGEVAGEVGELEVDLIAGRRPVRHRDPELLALEHRPTLMAALGDQRDRRAGQVVTEVRERVQVRVRTQQVGVAAAHQLLEAALERLTVGADLREPGGEDHRELGPSGHDLLERFDGPAGEDHGQVDVAGHLPDRGVAALAEHGLVHRMHREEGGAVLVGPLLDARRHRGVRLAGRLRRADDRHRRRVQERVEIHVAQPQRAAADVDGELGHGRSFRARTRREAPKDDTGVSNRASCHAAQRCSGRRAGRPG